ncbi:uncharacterized protein [Coffea arabica]|uniref:Secreted RxLR effector protein 161-like n=1 Tax=Coffea arabica TaxID=13443 RepID=A0A6P6WYS6_COFAR|nr:uncharacterized protein LOC113735854 [Coffea arabica]
MKGIPYSSVVGSLIYSVVCTKPDITYAISVLGRFLANPSHEHWVAATRLMRQSWLIACYEGGAHAKWLRNSISRLKFIDSVARPLKIYSDNSAAVFFIKNSGGAKYIGLKFFDARKWADNVDVLYENIATTNMLANPLTKELRPVVLVLIDLITLLLDHVSQATLHSMWNSCQ